MGGPGKSTVTPSRASTLADVARLAGVSISTASKALNGRGHVRAETRSRVVEAAERLSFSPEPARPRTAGRAHRHGRSADERPRGSVRHPDPDGRRGRLRRGPRSTVFLCDARGDAIREQHHVRALLSRRVDGLIVVGRRTDPRPSLGRDLPVPVVYAYAPSDDPHGPLDRRRQRRRRAARGRAPDRLRSHAGSPTSPATRLSRPRRTGSTGCAAAPHRRRARRSSARSRFGSWSEGWGRGAAAMLLDQHPDVDAVFCGSDQVARGVDGLAARARRAAFPTTSP